MAKSLPIGSSDLLPFEKPPIKKTLPHLLFALSLIVFIGACIANGALYSSLGYPSFAIGGGGLLLSLLLLVGATFVRVRDPVRVEMTSQSVDIDAEAPRFFFKEEEQQSVGKINRILDAELHEFMTEERGGKISIDRIKGKGFTRLGAFVLDHPQFDGWVMKGGAKESKRWISNQAGLSRANHFDNIFRVFMAERMSHVIRSESLNLIIPKKRLLLAPLAQLGDEPHKKYYVFSKKIDVLSPKETRETISQLMSQRQRRLAREVCLLIQKTGLMDAHLGNMRWSTTHQTLVILDTESLGALKAVNDTKDIKNSLLQCARIGLQHLKNKVGKHIPIFADEADRALAQLS